MRKWLGISLLSILCVCACTRPSGKAEQAPTAGKITVVATIFPLADWAAQVGGENVRAVTLLPAGSSPHTFEPTPLQMREVSEARLFLKVGLHLDDWAARLSSAAPPQIKTLSLGDDLQSKKQLPEVEHVLTGPVIGSEHGDKDHDHEGVNPHFWLDPRLAKLSVDEIQQALSTIDPAHAQAYAQNASHYKTQLDQLDAELSSTLARCKQRSFVSFHNGFPYLANRYGLNVAGVIEEYAGKTPSDRHVKEITDRLRALNTKVVFAEPQLNPRVADIVAQEIGGKVQILDPQGGDIFPDRNSYMALMRFNGQKLREALCEAGQAPSQTPGK